MADAHALTSDDVVELAVVERSGLVESRHLGAAVVIGADGSILKELGNTRAHVFGRSTLKFMQSIAVTRSGVGLEGLQLAMSAASHEGTDAHVAAVEAMLESAGLDAAALLCPPGLPIDNDTFRRVSTPERIRMNCSGKHAAFLMSCVANGWSITDYLDPGHPLQERIRATVEEFTGSPIAHSGVDGCGAPVFAVTLRDLGRSMTRVHADPAGAALLQAIRSDAWALDSPAVATVIEQLGVVAKNGAEGVFVAVTRDGVTVALKMLDGSTRASITAGLTLLASVNAVPADAAARTAASVTDPVLGAGRPVGQIRASDRALS